MKNICYQKKDFLQEVISDIVLVRSKYEEISCGDCKVSKQRFRALEKLMHCTLDGMESTSRVNGHGRSISRGWGLQVVLEPNSGECGVSEGSHKHG